MVPTAAGRRPVRTSAGRSGVYYHVWFAGMPEVLKHFQHALNPRPKNRNRFLFLTQLVAVAGGVLIFGGGSYCV